MHENKIKVIVGYAGSGKTLAMLREVKETIRDENNLAVIVGVHDEYQEDLDEKNNASLFHYDHLQNAIKSAVKNTQGNDENKMSFLFVDAGAYVFTEDDRKDFVNAMKKGVNIFITTQRFSMLDGGDIEWLIENCDTFVVSKHRTPRLLSTKEAMKLR